MASPAVSSPIMLSTLGSNSMEELITIGQSVVEFQVLKSDGIRASTFETCPSGVSVAYDVQSDKYGAQKYGVKFSSSPRISIGDCVFVHLNSPRSSRRVRTAVIDTELSPELAYIVDSVGSGGEDVDVTLNSYVEDTITANKYGIKLTGKVRRNTETGLPELRLKREAKVCVPRSDSSMLISGRHRIDIMDH